MRASLIIAAHNEGEALAKTVASCVETCAGLDYEIILSDDASDDGSVEEVKRRFPRVRLVQAPQRQGASPAKALGAEQARGDVLVFLDGHTKPEYGAVARLVEGVEELAGTCIVTPRIPALKLERWTNCTRQVGHGYRLDLETFDCGWSALGRMREVREKRKTFYESPALIGCALAVSRELYEKLWGFDRQMRYWGVEDLDFGLKCWLLGHRILHDPDAAVGHRFRTSFDNYSVPTEHVVVNQLRMARKHFTLAVWSEWVERCRQRHAARLSDHPEGLWARVWELFQAERGSVDQERSYLHGHRVRDEFWYAERFGLDWPRLHTAEGLARLEAATLAASPSPCPITVTFEKDPIRTGFTKPVLTSQIKVATYLRCDPPNVVSDIVLTIGGVDRVDIEIQEVIPETGYLIFRVKGKSATPANKPQGDTTIEARYQGEVCASIQAIVLVPRRIGTPHPEADGAVQPQNIAADAATSPAYFGNLNAGEVVLVTVYAQWLTIPVDDQFRDRLDQLYTGVPVEEFANNSWRAINQNLTANGTYEDPVFAFTYKGGQQQPYIVMGDSQEALDWPSAPAEAITEIDETQNISVKVGGHELSTGIVDRQLTTTAPDNVRIEWP